MPLSSVQPVGSVLLQVAVTVLFLFAAFGVAWLITTRWQKRDEERRSQAETAAESLSAEIMQIWEERRGKYVPGSLRRTLEEARLCASALNYASMFVRTDSEKDRLVSESEDWQGKIRQALARVPTAAEMDEDHHALEEERTELQNQFGRNMSDEEQEYTRQWDELEREHEGAVANLQAELESGRVRIEEKMRQLQDYRQQQS